MERVAPVLDRMRPVVIALQLAQVIREEDARGGPQRTPGDGPAPDPLLQNGEGERPASLGEDLAVEDEAVGGADAGGGVGDLWEAGGQVLVAA